MFLLEKLPPELLLMIMEELAEPARNVHGRSLLALISASPICLRLLNGNRALVINHLRGLARGALEGSPNGDEALGAASIRLQFLEHGFIKEGEDFQRLIQPHIDQVLCLDGTYGRRILGTRLMDVDDDRVDILTLFGKAGHIS
jgi:hypothetical protein